MHPEDEEWLQLIRDGDHGTFEQLVVMYQKKVYTIAFRFMGNPEDANDLAQEAFLRIYRSIHSFRGESSLQTWIYHVTANVCRDELRKRQKVPLIHTIDGDGEGREREIADSGLRPEELYEGKETQAHLQGLIDQLGDDYRTAVILRDVMGFSYDEISQNIGCSLGTVKSRISRGRQRLKELILEFYPELFRKVDEGRQSS